MITAGSVRGNCGLPQSVHISSWPALRTSSVPPQRGQKRVTNSHSARPSAWKTSGAPVSALVGEVRQQPAERVPPGVDRRALRRRDDREPGPAVLLPQQHPQALGRVRRRHPVDGAVDRPHPGPGHDEHAGLRVGPALLQPGVVRAAYRHPVVRAGRQPLVRVVHACRD